MNNVVYDKIFKILISALSTDKSQIYPCFIELLFAENIDNGLYKIIEHVVNTLDVYQSNAELSSIRNAGVNDDGGGSVGETLCGLKRTFRKSGPSDSGGMRGLSSRMINKLKMISNIVIPLIFIKLREVTSASGNNPSSSVGLWRDKLVSVGKSIVALSSTLYQLLVWKYEVQYLFQFNKGSSIGGGYSHPLFEYFDILLIKKDADHADIKDNNHVATAFTATNASGVSLGVLHRMIESVKPHITTTNVVSCAIIVYKVMDWWSRNRARSLYGVNNVSYGNVQSTMSGNIDVSESNLMSAPPCPEYNPNPKSDLDADSSHCNSELGHRCPLCKQDYTNRRPTSTPGGFVYCYQCIVGAIRLDPVCPRTKQRCLEVDLIQLKQQ